MLEATAGAIKTFLTRADGPHVTALVKDSDRTLSSLEIRFGEIPGRWRIGIRIVWQSLRPNC